MLSVNRTARKGLIWLLMVLFPILLAACVQGAGPAGKPVKSDRTGAAKVALLVPAGSGNASEEQLAQSLENAARLAMRDMKGVNIDLKVYNTSGNAAQAQAAAIRAADEGAEIILGPVFAGSANAAGVAVARRGINVLAFSNNPEIAGGNVFILGQTFGDTARRLSAYAVQHDKRRIMAVYEMNTAGELGRAAIQRGVSAAGGTLVASSGYEFSQNGVMRAAPEIVRIAREAGAEALFLTADTAGALPLLSQLLVENGLAPSEYRLIGLTRWDVPPQTASLPGIQGGWFAIPDPNLQAQFQSRYQAAYGASPHPIAGLAYDGMAAIGALVRQGSDLSARSLTQGKGFAGVSGIFRLYANGTNQRGLAIAEIRNYSVVVIDPAPRSFSGAGL